MGSCEAGCGEQLGCVSGVCTRSCESALDCSDLNAAAVCRSEPAATSAERVCDVACAGDDGCGWGIGLACRDGFCRVAPAAMSDSADSASLVAPVDPMNVDGSSASLAPAESGSALTPDGLPLACAKTTTLSGAIDIIGQAQLETLAGCEEIEGPLTLGAVTSLLPLRALRRVKTALNLSDLTLDPSESFEQLQSVDELRLGYGNEQVARAFPALTQLRTLTISGSKFVDLSGFERISGFETLTLTDNAALTSLKRGPVLDQLRYLTIFGSFLLLELGSLQVDTLERLELNGTGLVDLAGLERVGGNAGAARTGSSLPNQFLDPCPWARDGVCDACPTIGSLEEGYVVTGCPRQLCTASADREDCGG